MARLDKHLRGFGVLAAEWRPDNLNAAESSYTEADPRPGEALTTGTDVRFAPQVMGAQARDAVFAGSQAGGHPGLGELGGALQYRLADGETDSDLRSWEPPIRVTGAQGLSGPLADNTPNVVAFPLSGRVLVAWSGSAAWYLYDPHTSAWTTATNPDNSNSDVWALAVVPGTERVLAVDLRGGVTYASDDHGTTWRQVASYASLWDHSVGAGYYERATAAFDGSGNLVVVAVRASGSVADFWVSADLGCTWQLNKSRTSTATAVVCGHPDGSVHVAWLASTTGYPSITRMGSAWDDIDALTGVELDASTHSDLFLAADDDGVVWAYVRPSTGNNNRWDAWYTLDQGASYEGPVANVLWGGSTAAGDVFWMPQAVFAGGRCWLVWGEDPGTASNMFAGVATLGGWTSQPRDRQLTGVTPVASDPARALAYRFAFNNTTHCAAWLCHSTPINWSGGGWSHNIVGTGTIALAWGGAWTGIGGCDFGGSAVGDTAYAHQTITGGTDAHYVEWGGGRTDSVSITSEGGVGIRIQTPGYDYTIQVGPDAFRVYDHEAAAIAGAAVGLSGRFHMVDFRVLHNGSGTLTIAYREVETGVDAYTTRWTSITRTIASGGARSDLSVRYGIVSAMSGSIAINYRMMYANLSAFGTAGTYTLPADVAWGKAVGADHPYPLPDLSDPDAARQARFVVRGGPVLQGDTVTHDTAPGYPVEAMFPTIEPSPSRAWRSRGKGVNQDFVVDLGQGYATLPVGTWSYLLAVRGANVRQLELAGKKAGAYTTLGTLDLATGFTTGLTFSRAGRLLVPGSGSAAGARFVRAGELVGGHVVLNPGGTEVRRKILWNTGGWWVDDAGQVRVVLTLDGVDGTEPTAGNVHIVWPAGLMVVHAGFNTLNLWRYWRVRIPSTEEAVEDYYTVPDCGLYALHLPGKQWGHGWEWALSPNVRVDEDPYGTQRKQQMGPNRRELTLTWDHGALDGRVRGPSADYLGAPTGAPLAARDDVWGQLWGMWEVTQGGALPVVALMGDVDSGTTLTDPTMWLAGTLEGSLRVQEAAGRQGEGVDSFYRAGPLRVVERV